MTADQSIHSRAMLVSLSISTWSARKFDRAVTEKVNVEYAASPDAGRYNKHLFGGANADSHAAVIAAASGARRTHYDETLPWSNDGWRLLPSANYFDYTDKLRHARQKFESAREVFVGEYDALVAAATISLNGLFRPDDYPPAYAIASKFGFELDFSPVPTAGDFRLDLPADEIVRIEHDVTNRVEAATAEAMRDVWGRLYEAVTRIRDRLVERPNGEKPKYSDRMLDIARDTIDVLGRLNVTQNVELERLRRQLANTIEGLDAPTLRANDELRSETASQAQAILDAMKGVYTPCSS